MKKFNFLQFTSIFYLFTILPQLFFKLFSEVQHLPHKKDEEGYNMQRRKFLNLGATALAVSILPVSTLSAVDFRETSPQTWEKNSSQDAIKELFGSTEGISGVIKLKAPKLAENGASIPINIKSKVDLESIAVFQDANPRSAVAAFSVPEGGLVNFDLRIKMKQTSNVTVMGKGRDGKLYKTVQKVKVSIGGCGA